MQITLTTTRNGRTVHSRLSHAATLIAGLLLLVVLPASLGLLVYHYSSEARQAQAALPTSLTLSEAEARMAEYRKTIDALRIQSEANSNT